MTATDRETITLGGGCFWCVEAVMEQLRGVKSVTSGYAGGTTQNPSYYDVCSGETGHAEVIQINFDPREISLKDLLEVFFTTHDPTTLNQQGADIGTQYRSIVLYHTNEQKNATEQVIRDFSDKNVWGAPIVTEIEPFKEFYPAEEEHKEYYRRHPNQPYCQAVIAPKVAKLRKMHLNKLRKTDELTVKNDNSSRDRF